MDFLTWTQADPRSVLSNTRPKQQRELAHYMQSRVQSGILLSDIRGIGTGYRRKALEVVAYRRFST